MNKNLKQFLLKVKRISKHNYPYSLEGNVSNNISIHPTQAQASSQRAEQNKEMRNELTASIFKRCATCQANVNIIRLSKMAKDQVQTVYY